MTLPTPPDPAEIAERYVVLSRLGGGGYGTVYKARDRLLGRMVAIKVLRGDLLQGGKAFERFQLEGRALAGLKHPHIVTVYDMGQDKAGLSYLAMELVDGVTLDVLLVRERRLGWQRGVQIAAQIADALAFAHEKGIVHRDLKPANVMLETGDRVKVADFGIAKLPDVTRLTVTGHIVGTPGYMSPEQAQGEEVDGRSDIFALGCVLYEMLTGERAFSGDTLTVVIYRILNEDPAPLRSLDLGIPPELTELVTRALGKRPEGRPDAQAFSAALQRLGSPATLVPPLEKTRSLAVEPPETVRRTTPPSPGTAPTLLAGAAPAPKPRPRPPRPEPAPRGGGSPLVYLAVGCAALLGIGGFGMASVYFVLRNPRLLSSPVASPTGAPEPSPADKPSPAPSLVPSPAPSPVPTPSPVPSTAPSPRPPSTPPSTRMQETPRPRESPLRSPNPVPSPRVATAEASPVPTPRPSPTPRPEPSPVKPPEPRRGTGNEGRQVAGEFRKGGSGSNFGAPGHFRPRERDPSDLSAAETPVVAQLRSLIDAELAHYRRVGRYGNVGELVRAGDLSLGPHSPNQFDAHRYHFELRVLSDGFAATATPLQGAGRGFTGDDSGYIVANP